MPRSGMDAHLNKKMMSIKFNSTRRTVYVAESGLYPSIQGPISYGEPTLQAALPYYKSSYINKISLSIFELYAPVIGCDIHRYASAMNLSPDIIIGRFTRKIL